MSGLRYSPEEWETRRHELMHSLFADLPTLSPILEVSEEVSISSPRNYRLEAPLAELIIEVEQKPNRQDETEEFYQKLEDTMRRLYQKYYLNTDDVEDSIESSLRRSDSVSDPDDSMDAEYVADDDLFEAGDSAADDSSEQLEEEQENITSDDLAKSTGDGEGSLSGESLDIVGNQDDDGSLEDQQENPTAKTLSQSPADHEVSLNGENISNDDLSENTLQIGLDDLADNDVGSLDERQDKSPTKELSQSTGDPVISLNSENIIEEREDCDEGDIEEPSTKRVEHENFVSERLAKSTDASHHGSAANFEVPSPEIMRRRRSHTLEIAVPEKRAKYSDLHDTTPITQKTAREMEMLEDSASNICTDLEGVNPIGVFRSSPISSDKSDKETTRRDVTLYDRSMEIEDVVFDVAAAPAASTPKKICSVPSSRVTDDLDAIVPYEEGMEEEPAELRDDIADTAFETPEGDDNTSNHQVDLDDVVSHGSEHLSPSIGSVQRSSSSGNAYPTEVRDEDGEGNAVGTISPPDTTWMSADKRSKTNERTVARKRQRLISHSSSSHSSARERVDRSAQNSFSSDSVDFSSIWSNFFVGVPTVYRLCTCKDHQCV